MTKLTILFGFEHQLVNESLVKMLTLLLAEKYPHTFNQVKIHKMLSSFEFILLHKKSSGNLLSLIQLFYLGITRNSIAHTANKNKKFKSLLHKRVIIEYLN